MAKQAPNPEPPRARVTFYVEADDPSHPTGLAINTFDRVHNVVSDLGGYDVEVELERQP